MTARTRSSRPARGAFARWATVTVLVLLAAVAGAVTGALFAFSEDLPEISALDNYQPNTITRLLAGDGQVIGEFAVERRLLVDYDEISPYLRDAIIASEDAEFEQHFGLSISRIAITAVKDLLTGQRAGASTITQQVARLLFLSRYMRDGVFERSLERKIREAIVAIQLEKRYTKREIFTFYANQINLGAPGYGAYGVEAASRLYFGKPARDLSLDEAATIAAVVQTPSRLSPFVNPDSNRARRNNYVLPRMAAEGFITEEEAREAASRPLALQPAPVSSRALAPYFAEEIRKHLEAEYGADRLYQSGLQVQTTLDVRLQTAANLAIERGLRRIDKRRSGYRGAERNVLADGAALDAFRAERWNRPMAAGDIVPAVVTFVPSPDSREPARIRIAEHELPLLPSAIAWARRPASALFEVGDLIDVEIRTLDDGQPATVALEQTPLVEGGLVAIDNRTGEVRAMVGGFSFARSKFNRATQARRQMGSTFKPIVYTAAIDRGMTPVSILADEPIEYEAGPNQPPYIPQNYDRLFEGQVTLRRALEQSRNIPAVNALIQIGPSDVLSYAGRFGLPSDMPPYLSLALGSAEASLIDVTSAYSAFPNHGVRMEPFLLRSVSDREGNVLEEHRPSSREAIRADTAYVMTSLLRGVVQRGTAASAASLDWPLAGKTGTVDDNTDAWFVGFDPEITVGVWVGHDEKKPLGNGETGASAALPIWIDFMRAHIEAVSGSRTEPPQFEAPSNIAFVTLESGMTEAFINGTQPQADGEVLGLPPMGAPAPGLPPQGPSTPQPPAAAPVQGPLALPVGQPPPAGL
ncbi:MAG: PBP1A family penicillin-binding protein [Vicinamibacterales bacterium]